MIRPLDSWLRSTPKLVLGEQKTRRPDLNIMPVELSVDSFSFGVSVSPLVFSLLKRSNSDDVSCLFDELDGVPDILGDLTGVELSHFRLGE